MADFLLGGLLVVQVIATVAVAVGICWWFATLPLDGE